MSAWPGGNCPDCGDFMPPNLITCQTCRAMLNSSLQVNPVDVPAFIPLKEIETPDIEESDTELITSGGTETDLSKEVLLIESRGAYYNCPNCAEQLKIPKQYFGQPVQCNKCSSNFQMDFNAASEQKTYIYVDCPHCEKRIRSPLEMVNQNIQCNFCKGALYIKL